MTFSDQSQKYGIYALYLTCFFCLFSTALTAAFSVIMLICWLASGRIKNMGVIIRENFIALLGIVFCTLLFIGMLYSPASLEESLDIFKKYRILLYIPILLSLTKGQPNIARNIVYALLLGYLLILINALLVDFNLIDMNKLAWKRQGGGYLVIFAYLVFQRIITEKKFKILWGIFFIAVCYDLFFILNTRTGWLILIALNILFIIQYLTLKKQLIFFFLSIIFLAGVYYSSTMVQNRVTATIEGLKKYDANAFKEPQKEIKKLSKAEKRKRRIEARKRKRDDRGRAIRSVTIRLDWYQISLELIKQKPFFGYGTGAFQYAQKAAFPNSSVRITKDPHSEFLLTAVQIGLVGVLVLLAIFIDPIRRSFKLIRLHKKEQAFALQATVLYIFTGCLLNSLLLSTIPSHIFAFLIVAFYPVRNTTAYTSAGK